MPGEPPASDRKEKKQRKRKKGIYKKIAAQLEFYFSDANLRKSKFLKDLIDKDPWVPLAVFSKFNRIKELLTELGEDDVEKHVLKALEVGSSTFFQISEDKNSLRRVPQLVEKDDVEECTVYVENLPKDTTHESLKAKFAEYGSVAYVSIPKFRNTNRIKGFAFVEFESKESVRQVIDAYSAPSQVNPAGLQSVQAYLEEHEDEGKGKENEKSALLKRKHEDEEDDDEAPKRLRIDENVQSDLKKEREDAMVHGLQVLTKTNWRRLRNRYLNEQRKNMSAAKALLRRRKEHASVHPRLSKKQVDTGGESSNGLATAGSRGTVEDSAKTGGSTQSFTPGLIVQFSIESGIDDPKSLKKTVRELADVAYVDAKIGQNQFFVRCRDTGQAESLASAAPDNWKGCIIKGEDEASYWKRIEEDKHDKRSGKVVVPKQKSKKRLLAKVEAVKSTHVYFDE